MAGENIAEVTSWGLIKSSTNPAWPPGKNIFNYIHARHHRSIPTLMSLAEKNKKPVVYEFETKYKGKYIKRIAQIYHTNKGTFMCQVVDRIKDIIEFDKFENNTINEFILNYKGIVLEVKYPEKVITDPVGINIFDVLLPEYKKQVRHVMDEVIEKRVPLPIEYEFMIKGEHRYKKGVLSPRENHLHLKVQRIAKPTQKEAI